MCWWTLIKYSKYDITPRQVGTTGWSFSFVLCTQSFASTVMVRDGDRGRSLSRLFICGSSGLTGRSGGFIGDSVSLAVRSVTWFRFSYVFGRIIFLFCTKAIPVLFNWSWCSEFVWRLPAIFFWAVAFPANEVFSASGNTFVSYDACSSKSSSAGMTSSCEINLRSDGG